MAHYYRNRIERVAEAISELRYKELQALATTLADMANDRGEQFTELTLKSEELAELLADWADFVECQISEAEEAEDAG